MRPIERHVEARLVQGIVLAVPFENHPLASILPLTNTLVFSTTLFIFIPVFCLFFLPQLITVNQQVTSSTNSPFHALLAVYLPKNDVKMHFFLNRLEDENQPENGIKKDGHKYNKSPVKHVDRLKNLSSIMRGER